MKFQAWEARKHIEAKYKYALRKLGRYIASKISRYDALKDIQRKFKNIQASKPFKKWAYALAHTFVTNTLEENARTWRQAAQMSGQGQSIRNSLEHNMEGRVWQRYNELIEENAKYIQSVPQELSKRIVKLASEYALNGRRNLEENEEFKKAVIGLSDSHAKLIARTETSKAQSALVQAQAEDTGHDWYIWRTSEDQRVRKSHKNMNGVLCRFSDPPAPEKLVNISSNLGRYNAGNCPNCRCYAQPVILWRKVEWPYRVCAGGEITMMSKKEFQNRFGAIK